MSQITNAGYNVSGQFQLPMTTNLGSQIQSSKTNWSSVWLGIAFIIVFFLAVAFIILYIMAKKHTCPICKSPSVCPIAVSCPSCANCQSSSPSPSTSSSSSSTSSSSPSPSSSTSSPSPSPSSPSSSSPSPSHLSAAQYITSTECSTDNYIPWGSYLQNTTTANYFPGNNTLTATNTSNISSKLIMSNCGAGSGVSWNGNSLVCDIPANSSNGVWLPFCSPTAPNALTAPITESPNSGGTTMLPGGNWYLQCTGAIATSQNGTISAICGSPPVSIKNTGYLISKCPVFNHISGYQFTCPIYMS